jgi:cytochrome b561
MGLTIIGIIIAGFIMTSLEPNDQKWFIYAQHKAFGMIILALIPLRILWRLINPQPKLPKNTPNWQAKAANLNIFFLYLCMLVMPLSGFIMSSFGGHPISIFNLFTIPAFEKHQVAGLMHETHEILAWGIAASVTLHILGALHHHFILKDTVLKRMISEK